MARARQRFDPIKLVHFYTFYPQSVVDDWQNGLAADVYLKAMKRVGEVISIATGEVEDNALILGFASDYCIEGSEHGTSVYVRGIAARRGIGSALFRLAEAHAAARGATTISIGAASLAGVEFYRSERILRGGARRDAPVVRASDRLRVHAQDTRSVPGISDSWKR